MADILDVITRQRKELAAIERDTVIVLTDRWQMIAKDLEKRYTTLLDEIEMLRATGQEVTIGRIFRTERARALFIQAEQQYAEYAKLLGQSTDQLMTQSALKALADADEMTRYALGPIPSDAIGSGLFVQLPTDAVNDLVATMQSGPLNEILASYGTEATASLRTALVTGLAYGENPIVVARRMAAAMGGNLARARTIARTEMMRAYREGTRRWYKANSKVVKGWVWHSATDTRTCAACWAMHGTEFDTDEPMGTHPNCRCAIVPKTKSWKELGFNVPDKYESQYQGQTGSEIFAQLTDDEQTIILGRKGKALYDSGDLHLGDLVRETHTQQWGVTRSRDSLARATAKARQRGGAPPTPRPAITGKRTPLPKDTPELEKRFRQTRAKAARDARRIANPMQSVRVPKAAKPPTPPATPARSAFGQELDKIKGARTRADWTEAEIRQAGAVTRKEIEKRANVGHLEAEFRSLKIEQGDLQRRLRDQMDAYSTASWAERDRIAQEIDNLIKPRLAQVEGRLKVIEPQMSERRIQAAREVLSDARGGKFGTSQATMHVEEVPSGYRSAYGRAQPRKRLPGGTEADAGKLFREGNADFPDDWWDEFAAQSQTVRGGRGWRVGINDRGYYSNNGGEIFISANGYASDRLILEGMRSTVRHELGHAMEHVIPDIARLEKEFYKRRTKGESLVRLRDLFGNGYGAKERVRVDNFQHPYMGKDYGRTSDFWEIFTMGIESVLSPWDANGVGALVAAKDLDYLDFILGILAAL